MFKIFLSIRVLAIQIAADVDHHEVLLRELRDRLDAIYAGRSADCVADRAFALVVRRNAIPYALPAALLEGFEWDANGRRYETLDDLQEYAARVAGSVGAMMALLMGARSPAALARACDLCVAMQLTNIARDVGEDARNGRLYLPLEWLREGGIDPEAFLSRPVFSAALAGIVHRLLEVADLHYATSESAITRLPATCRPGIMAARMLYAEIGREVERSGCNSVDRRAVVQPLRKAMLMAKAMTALMSPATAVAPLPEANFLIDAVAAAPADGQAGQIRGAPPLLDLGRRSAIAKSKRCHPATESGWSPRCAGASDGGS